MVLHLSTIMMIMMMHYCKHQISNAHSLRPNNESSQIPLPSAFHSLLAPSASLASSCLISSPMPSARPLLPAFFLRYCVYCFYHLPLYPAVQLDVLAVVVDVVAGVVDVQGHVLVLQVLLQPALVRLTTPQLLIHLQKHLADQHRLQDK